MKVESIGLITVMLILSGCASNSGVIEISEQTYFIARQAATGLAGTGGIKTGSLKEAATFCMAKKKKLNVVELSENEGPFILGKYPRVELTFECK